LKRRTDSPGNAVLQVGQILKVPAQSVAPADSAARTEADKVAASTTKLPAEGVAAAVTQAAPAAGTPVAAPASEQTAGGTQYTGGEGQPPENREEIAASPLDELMKANGITDPKKIQIGQGARQFRPRRSKAK